ETPSVEDHRKPPENVSPEWDMVTPITIDEVTRHLKELKDGAAGPDHRRKSDLLKLKPEALVCRFNIWLLAGIAPNSFRQGVTVLIPKSPESTEPKNFRPITLGPILCRLYHRILAERVDKSYRISIRQKAFCKTDGIADNTHILRTILADRKMRCQKTNIAFLDVSKAFDSVSHQSILLAAASAGIPPPLVAYIESLYRDTKTRLRVNEELSPEISVNRGVKQGDPLSPILFNAVIDLALRHADTRIGVPVGEEILSCLAFADDLVLFSTTPKGLQMQFYIIEFALKKCGLALNVSKSATIRIDVMGKSKVWCCNPIPYLKSRNSD
ncbi:MAG: reverse transcriptase family protein, partial [Chromatiales bacterium]